MTMKQLLRQDFAQYVRPHFEKSECEVCGSDTERLHVHHTTHFQDLLDETLQQLDLEYYEDTDSYTEEELQLIRDVMLAKQMRINYVTCCEPCHRELHEGSYNPEVRNENKMRELSRKGNEAKKRKKQLREHQHREQIKPYLDSMVGVKITPDLRQEFIDRIQPTTKQGRPVVTPNPINEWFSRNGLNYVVKSEIDGKNRKAIWIVEQL